MKLVYVILLAVFALLLVIFVGCTHETITPEELDDRIEEKAEKDPDSVQAGAWKEAQLVDALTGETFTVSDFKGKPVLIESFAVWCPTCKRQQDEFKKLHEEVGDSVISIALDTDPNEDVDKVKEHAERHGFDWYFVVSPVEVSKKLIEEFGVGVVNAPSAPVVLICEDQTTKFLRSGVKSASDLKEEIEMGCHK